MTLARGDIDELRLHMPRWQSSWPGGSFECTALTVVTRGADTPFVEHQSLPLCGRRDSNCSVAKLRLLVGPVLFDERVFRLVVTEEIWRRAFRQHYKSK